MDFELIEKALPILLLGAGVTIEITAVSVFIGFCIGLFVGIAAADAKATVQVEQASTENSGVATVTVTAEDGTAETYTVTFGELPQLAERAVEVT